MTSPAQTREDVAAHLDRYLATFNSGDFTLTAESYLLPCAFIGVDGVRNVDTTEKFVEQMSTMVSSLRARGFVKSFWTDKQIFPLADRLALASCTFERRRADGTVIEDGCATYTLQRGDGGWRIVSILGHPVPTKLIAPG
ncbi:MAG: hypothetical protein JWN95_1076 [Frankiales bacterium]|nr:hypothetical protein [Frankiales bacterium]